MSETSKNDQLILFFCASSGDLLKCWKSYSCDCYRVLLFAKSGVKITINGEQFSPDEKFAMLIRNNDVCEFSWSGGGSGKTPVTEAYAIFIGKRHYNSVKKLLGSPQDFETFENDALPRIYELDDILYDKIIRELKHFNQLDIGSLFNHVNSTKLFVASLFYAFIVNANHHAARFTDAPKWFDEYYDLICRPEVFTRPFEEVVGLSGKTREHLSRVFKSISGANISDFIVLKRINYACALLKDVNMTIPEVVKKSGFTNIGTFYSNFKKKTGESPERYRKMILMGEVLSVKKK